MKERILKIFKEENIDETNHEKLIKLLENYDNNIQNNQGTLRIKLLKKIIDYIGYNEELVSHKKIVEINIELLKNIKATFPLTKEEELIEIASIEYINNKINIKEYLEFLYPKENKVFDGKLTTEEIERLEKAGFTPKQIEEIKNFIMEKKDYLSGFHDLVGDDLIPTKQFLFNIKHIGKIFDKDVETAISKPTVLLRKSTTARLIKAVGGYTLSSKQIFENRNELMNNTPEPDKGITLPKEPVIWVPNHHFKDDAMASIEAAKRPFYFMFGSIPLYFNTIDGFLTYLNGAILINRNNKQSKKDSLKKAAKAIDYGVDLFWAVEATHNKTANLPMLELWNGVYRLANEKGIKVVPIAHYIKDPTRGILPNKLNPIHTVVDEPIDLTQYSEKSGLTYLRDVISTWYYLMMEKYGKMTREELINEYQKRAIFYGVNPEEFEQRPLTTAEIGSLYNMDLKRTVVSYDRSTEIISDFRSEDIIRPEEAFQEISQIQDSNHVQDALYAKKLIKDRKYEDYQRRY